MATLVFHSSIFFSLLIFKLIAAAVNDSFWNVRYLPGFPGPLPFELETGYVGVGDSEEVQLFYYFVKSQGNPQADPLMTWYIGGPGCSALLGLAIEIGPLSFKVGPYNGSLPQLILNPHTWTKKVSILFIDSPVGAGFSYSRSLQGSKMGDHRQVEQNHQFLRKWLANHPEFISNSFYVGGDSYSGIIIPPLTQAISKGNKHDFPVINLQGYIEGNPVTIRKRMGNWRIPYAYCMNLISNELYESLTSSCQGENMGVNPFNGKQLEVDTDNEECLKNVATFEKSVEGINIWCTSWPLCDDVSSAPQSQMSGQRRSLSNNTHKALSPPSLDCQEYRYYLAYYWANNDQVQKALHIREGSKEEWVRCQNHRAYEYDLQNVVPYHVNLSSKGYRSLIFSGDHDMMVPIIETEAWIKSLNYFIIDDWRPWFDRDHQVLGYTRTYANNMTFATIKGGGHTPEYMQYQSGIMFTRWIDGKSL